MESTIVSAILEANVSIYHNSYAHPIMASLLSLLLHHCCHCCYCCIIVVVIISPLMSPLSCHCHALAATVAMPMLLPLPLLFFQSHLCAIMSLLLQSLCHCCHILIIIPSSHPCCHWCHCCHIGYCHSLTTMTTNKISVPHSHAVATIILLSSLLPPLHHWCCCCTVIASLPSLSYAMGSSLLQLLCPCHHTPTAALPYLPLQEK